MPHFTTAPSLDDLEALADEAFTSIPDFLRQQVTGVVFVVEDFPDDEVCQAMGLESPFDLLGLYSGVGLTRKSIMDQPEDLNRVFLYRRPILDYWCETGENLADIVRHVLIHEIGHYFGYSDADMDQIEENDELP